MNSTINPLAVNQAAVAQAGQGMFSGSSMTGGSQFAGFGSMFSGGIGTIINAMPTLATGFASIYSQNQAAKALRSYTQFQQKQLDFQSRILNLRVQERVRELRKKASQTASSNIATAAARGFVPTVGTSASLFEQPFSQADEDVDTLAFNQAVSNIGLKGQRGIIGAESSAEMFNRKARMGQTAQNLLKSLGF